MNILSDSVEETMSIGTRLAKQLKTGDIVVLSGIFGAGKTYFTKGIARGLGVKDIKKVVSPSFVLGAIHQGRKLKLYHFDAQRLANAKELLNLGLGECFYDGVCVIEWGEKIPELKVMPASPSGGPNIISVKFEAIGKNKRALKIRRRQKNSNI